MEIRTNGYVSADGHVVEPADLWTTRMDKRFVIAPHGSNHARRLTTIL